MIEHNDDNILIGKNGKQLYWQQYNNDKIEVYSNKKEGVDPCESSMVIFDKSVDSKRQYIGPIKYENKMGVYYLKNYDAVITYKDEYDIASDNIIHDEYCEIGGIPCFHCIRRIFSSSKVEQIDHIVIGSPKIGLLFPKAIAKSGNIIVMKSDVIVKYNEYSIYKVKQDENELNWDNWVDIEKMVYNSFSRDSGEEKFLMGLAEIIVEADALKIDNIGEKYSGEIDQLKDEVSYYVLSKLLEKEITDDNILDEVIGDSILLKTIVFNEAGKVVTDYIANSSYWLGV